MNARDKFFDELGLRTLFLAISHPWHVKLGGVNSQSEKYWHKLRKLRKFLEIKLKPNQTMIVGNSFTKTFYFKTSSKRKRKDHAWF